MFGSRWRVMKLPIISKMSAAGNLSYVVNYIEQLVIKLQKYIDSNRGNTEEKKYVTDITVTPHLITVKFSDSTTKEFEI